ncbi:MAG: hypothetical protein OEM28_00345 [Nitrosopumilus sp.]|nr:hypothetical protein [Nitrosopumilus sp.]MDH3487343.1 hypothetical protein [Nitrosopumilus sp.]
MPADAYITVTLKKETVKTLIECKPNQATSKAVTEAINEYVDSRKNLKATNRTYDNVSISSITSTPTISYS